MCLDGSIRSEQATTATQKETHHLLCEHFSQRDCNKIFLREEFTCDSYICPWVNLQNNNRKHSSGIYQVVRS
jgi:hypothetical protein